MIREVSGILGVCACVSLGVPVVIEVSVSFSIGCCAW